MTYDPVRKTMVAMPPYGTMRPQTAKPADIKLADGQTADVKGAAKEEDFFDHLWDVVNPLQHLPVIGTIYRAATGERLDAVEKIAGDALYGGIWGAASAVAGLAFEAITGKSVEDTVLAWLDLDGADNAAPSMVAAASITPKHSLPSGELPDLSTVDVASAAPDTFDILALSGALSAKGVSSDTANRALYAYRRSTALTAPYTPVIASLN